MRAAGRLEARRRVVVDALAVSSSSASFGLVYGLAARDAGLSVAETVVMSVAVLAGSAQFAAVGLLAQGAPGVNVLLTTVALNARHVLYGPALMPWLASWSRLRRIAAGYILTDEVFALAVAHFRRTNRADLVGYWSAGMVPAAWIVTGAVGWWAGDLIPDPNSWGLGVVFPVAMGGLAVGFMGERDGRAAAAVAALAGVVTALIWPYPLAVVVATVAGVSIGSRFRG